MPSTTARVSRRRRSRDDRTASPAPADAFTLATGRPRRPAFDFLDDDAIALMKARAIDILDTRGVIVIHQDGAARLAKAGATPGDDANRLRLPRALVEEALEATPKSVTLCGKSPARDIHLPRSDGQFIMRTGTGAHGFVDPETSAYRNLTVEDVSTIAAVGNGLGQVGFIAHPFVHGVPELTSDIHSLAALIARTDKHVWIQPYNKENVEYLFRLAAIAAGGEAELRARPLASCIVCSFSPLEFKVMDVEAMIQAGKAGLPIHACSLPSAGGTAPLTTPGLVLMAAAEILAMVTMAHVLAPGTPVIATPLMFTLDMRTGSALQSCVESRQAVSMAIQLMKRGFGLIAHSYGAGSDTPDVDVQSMAERALLGQDVAMSGADILGGIGQLECATVFSPVQAVLDNELGAMLRAYMQVPDVSEESLNWEEILTVDAGGHFLASEHTLKYCRHQHVPQVFMRQGRDDYEKSGRRNALDEARDLCLDLMKRPAPEGLPDETAVAEMADVVAAADKHILAEAAANANVVTQI